MLCFAALGQLLDEEVDATHMGMYMCTYIDVIYTYYVSIFILQTRPDTQSTSPDTQIQVQTPKYKSRHPNTSSDIQNTSPDI